MKRALIILACICAPVFSAETAIAPTAPPKLDVKAVAEAPKLTFDQAVSKYYIGVAVLNGQQADFNRTLTDQQKQLQQALSELQKYLQAAAAEVEKSCSGKVAGLETGQPKCEKPAAKK